MQRVRDQNSNSNESLTRPPCLGNCFGASGIPCENPKATRVDGPLGLIFLAPYTALLSVC